MLTASLRAKQILIQIPHKENAMRIVHTRFTIHNHSNKLVHGIRRHRLITGSHIHFFETEFLLNILPNL